MPSQANITEFVFYKIKPGHATHFLNPTTPEGQALTQAFTHIRNAKGCQRLAYGVPDEDQDVLVALFDWDTIEAHTTFRDTHDQTPQQSFWAYLAGMPFFFHAAIKYDSYRSAEMKTLLMADVTEITLRYYPTSVIAEEMDKYQAALVQDLAVGIRVSGGAGWAVEEVEREGIGMAKALVSLAGFEMEGERVVVGKSLKEEEGRVQLKVFNVKLRR